MRTTDWRSRYRALRVQEEHPGVLEIVLDNPRTLNAITEEAHAELARIWRDLDQDPAVRAVLVRGEGGNFSSGGDLALVQRIQEDEEVRLRVWREARDLVYGLVNCSRPVVSAVQGVAVGAGLAVALLADVSVVGRSARLLDGHVRLGVPAGDHAVLCWPLLVGLAKAKYHLLLNEPLSGEDAERLGLVSLCVDDDQVDATARTLARRLAESSPNAVRWTKYALNNWLRLAGPLFDTSTALEFLGFVTRDAAEGLASLRQKRPPRFPTDSPL